LSGEAEPAGKTQAPISDRKATSLDPRQQPDVRKMPDGKEQPDAGKANEHKSQSLRSLLARRPGTVAAVVILVVAGLGGALIWWRNARHYESTDDAFIDARNVSISSQVNGAIVEVPVTDNQPVEAGVALVRIDDRD